MQNNKGENTAEIQLWLEPLFLVLVYVRRNNWRNNVVNFILNHAPAYTVVRRGAQGRRTLHGIGQAR